MKSRIKVAAASVGALIASSLTVVLGLPVAQAAISVPTCPATTLTRTGAQTSGISQSNSGGTWNLTGATWSNTTLGIAVHANTSTNACIQGGSVDGDIGKTVTRDAWFDGVGGTKRDIDDAIVFTQTNTANNFAVYKNNYAEDYEDAYDFQSVSSSNTGRVYLDHVEAKYVRDDCIENEGSSGSTYPVANVYVKNSLFDNCFTGVAWRPNSSGAGSNTNASLTIEDSLMRVGQQPLGTESGKYCTSSRISSGRCQSAPTSVSDSGLVGLYGIWKTGSESPASITVRNTIFRIDAQSYSSCSPWDWPNGTYENVTLVWAGAGDYYRLCSGSSYALPSGVTLTTDLSVWNNAVSAWRNGGGTPPPPPPTNAAPTVSAGPDRATTLPDNEVALDGTVTDDGLPSGSSVTQSWSKVTGPGTVEFTSPNAADTAATINVAGTYVLRLTATDGSLSASDDVTVVVNPEQTQTNQPPTANAGPDASGNTVPYDSQYGFANTSVNLSPSWSDPEVPSCDQSTTKPCTTVMSLLSGPSGANTLIKDANEGGTSFTADLAGTYTLRLTVTDFEGATATDDVVITLTDPVGGGTSGISVVGSTYNYSPGSSVVATIPSGVQSGDKVVFQAGHNQGSSATFDVPGGLTALGAEVDDGSSLASRLYTCTVPCSAGAYTFTSSSSSVYETTVTAVAYRGVGAVTQVAHVADTNTDAAHPVSGTTTASGWNAVFALDRYYVTGSTPSTWTLGSNLTERVEGGGTSTANSGKSSLSQVVGDTNAVVAAGSKTYQATASHASGYGITGLVQLSPLP